MKPVRPSAKAQASQATVALLAAERAAMRPRPCRMRAFTLVEVLFVLAIISLLAALLFPVFFTARGKARQVVCASNLRQIGMGMAMYAQDHDGLYPFALDPADKYTPQMWNGYPEFQALIPTMPMVHEVLQPYVNSKTLFRCPADTGYTVDEFSNLPLDATPSAFERFGTSYFYHTDITRKRPGENTIQSAAEYWLFYDMAGRWHGTLAPLAQRYNALFADGHVKNLNYNRIYDLPKPPL